MSSDARGASDRRPCLFELSRRSRTVIESRDLCVGRSDERERFQEFVRSSPPGAGVDVCFVRGLGGIGKTTLMQTIAEDFLQSDSQSTVLSIDCSALPAQPPIAALLRALPGTPVQERALRAAAVRLDRIGSAVRFAGPPPDSDESTVALWPSVRSLAAESLRFFSAAAVEQLAFGQLAATATNAVVAGAQAVSAGATSVTDVIASLRRQGELDEADSAVATDLDAYVAEVLREYVEGCGSANERVLIAFDKAENLTEVLRRIVALFDTAAVRAHRRLLLTFAGRLVRLPSEDGSLVEAPRFLETFPGSTLDLELSPFDGNKVLELIRAHHDALHGFPSSPPSWVVEAVLDASGGLPLWAATVAEAILAGEPDPWKDETSVMQVLGGGAVDVADIITVLFRDAKLPSGETAYPLLVALAIAPPTYPRELVCAAADSPSSAVAELTKRYSFMRKSSLHETARAVLRQALAESAESDPVLTRVAGALRAGLLQRAPAGSPHGASEEWTQYIQDLVSLELWSDTDAGIVAAVNYVLTGLPWTAPWIGPVFRDCGWFVGRRRVGQAAKLALSTCARAAYPLLLAEALGAGDRDAGALQKAIVSSARQDATFSPLIGRAFDEIDRLARRGRLALDQDARVSLDALRAAWLVTNGFDDVAGEIALGLAGPLQEIEDDAPVRESIGDTLLRLLENSASWTAAESGQAREGREAQADELLSALLTVNPGRAAVGVRVLIRAFGLSGSRERVVSRLMERRADHLTDLPFVDSLGNALSCTGAFADAERLYREALARSPDWIGGAVGRGRALLCQGLLDEAIAFLAESFGMARDKSNLSAYGEQRRRELATELALAFIVAGRLSEVDERIGPDELTSYGRLVRLAFGPSPSEAHKELAKHADGQPRMQAALAAEATIIFCRCDELLAAERAAALWTATPSRTSLETRTMDALLLRRAMADSIVPATVSAVLDLDGASQETTQQALERDPHDQD